MGMEREVQKAVQKAQGSLVRLDELEKRFDNQEANLDNLAVQIKGQGESIKQIVSAVNGSLGQLNRGLEEYKEMLNAVIGILGPSQVQAEIESNRALAMQKQVDETRASIAEGLAKGEVIAAEIATEKSFVAGVETKADGTVIAPGWTFVPMTRIEEDYRKQLIGQKVGFKVATKEGGNFELLEIYEAVEKKADAPAAAAAPTEAAPETAPVQG